MRFGWKSLMPPPPKGVVFQFNKLEFMSPKDVCAKFGRNWPSSGEDDNNVRSLQGQQQFR